MYDHDYSWNSGLTGAGVFFFLVLAIIGALFFTTYMSQRNDIRDLRQEVNQLKHQSATTTSPSTGNGSTNTTNPTTTYTSAKGVKADVYQPIKNAKVASPVAVVGEIPGSWSFEASFPVQLKDSKGNIIARTTAQVLGNWMTDLPVPFSAKLTYDAAVSGTGSLVLVKDNPSGQADKDDSISIPIHY